MSSLIQRIKKSNSTVNILYVPLLALMITVIFIPFFNGLKMSFTDWDGYSQTYNIIGLKNYQNIFTDARVITTIKNTFIYGFGSTLFQNILGLMFAMIFMGNTLISKFMRTIIYLPVIASGLIMGYVWYFFFQYSGGTINDILLLFSSEPIDWLADPNRSVAIITLVNIFQFLGISMVIYLAGLRGIPDEYYEAAEIDGASKIIKFKYVTLPLLMPSINASVVMNLIGGLKLFDVIMALTKGGPGYGSMSLSTMMYTLYFARADAGYAAALGVFMVILIGIISLSALVYFRGKEVEL